jgi:hypothetical protein
MAVRFARLTCGVDGFRHNRFRQHHHNVVPLG